MRWSAKKRCYVCFIHIFQMITKIHFSIFLSFANPGIVFQT
ncbi:Hypothetical protein EAG7_02085 [Klebsiella aerogenes]|nr:Hypothetical protein EAG7_02085 [Klebsiella aerogenes]CCG30559.1 hypothetical protein [Klebsiella aerogenes EA1509E]